MLDSIKSSGETRANLVPGQILKQYGYGNSEYIIIKVEAPDKGCEFYGPRYTAVNLDNGRLRLYRGYELKVNRGDNAGIRTKITYEVRGPDAIMDAIKLREKTAAAAVEAAKKAAQEKAEQIADLKKKYPYLELAETSKKTPWALGASNIRRELKKAFPGIKFSVRSSAYSMGCSIDIGWPRSTGVSQKDVEAITDKYQYGSFDGMTDSYNYSKSPWDKLYGGAKFVFAQPKG